MSKPTGAWQVLATMETTVCRNHERDALRGYGVLGKPPATTTTKQEQAASDQGKWLVRWLPHLKDARDTYVAARRGGKKAMAELATMRDIAGRAMDDAHHIKSALDDST